MNARTTAEFLTAEEAAHRVADGYPSGFLTCKPCQDFRTDVSFGVEHPCRHCQPVRFRSWRLGNEGDVLRVQVDGIEGDVMAPPDGGSIVQPCEGSACAFGCVLVRPVLGGDARWVEVDRVEITTPWHGA
jgi:hypothetical protein